MKKLRMAKKIFQRCVFYKRLTYITLICNHKATAICAYFRKAFFAKLPELFRGYFWWRRGVVVITTTQLHLAKPWCCGYKYYTTSFN